MRPRSVRVGTEVRGYDALGRLTSQRLEVGATAYDATKIHYNEWGYVDNIDRNDSLLPDTQTFYDYTVQGELASYRLERAGSSAQADFIYDDQGQGNLKSRSGFAFGALALSSYVAAGPFDARNRVNAPGWEYDDAGRLTADEDYLYSYNRAGRLALVTDRSGNLVGHYLYDAGGLRVRKMTETAVTYTYRDPAGAVIAEQTYALDNQELLISQRDYVSHNGDNVMIAHVGEDAGFERRLSDRLGNPVVRWRQDDVKLQEYSPFGEQMHHDPASQHEGPYDYTGHERDAETEHIYMRARYYDPQTARFGRPDPVRDFSPYQPASYNLYQYTNNNPINFTDPTGLVAQASGCNKECIESRFQELRRMWEAKELTDKQYQAAAIRLGEELERLRQLSEEESLWSDVAQWVWDRTGGKVLEGYRKSKGGTFDLIDTATDPNTEGTEEEFVSEVASEAMEIVDGVTDIRDGVTGLPVKKGLKHAKDIAKKKKLLDKAKAAKKLVKEVEKVIEDK